MKRPLMRHSAPSPARTGFTLLRTSAPQKNGVRRNIGRGSLLHAQSGNVKRGGGLAFQAVVRYDRAVAHRKLRGGVAKSNGAIERNVVLDNRRLAALFRHDEVARMAHDRRAVA